MQEIRDMRGILICWFTLPRAINPIDHSWLEGSELQNENARKIDSSAVGSGLGVNMVGRVFPFKQVALAAVAVHSNTPQPSYLSSKKKNISNPPSNLEIGFIWTPLDMFWLVAWNNFILLHIYKEFHDPNRRLHISSEVNHQPVNG